MLIYPTSAYSDPEPIQSLLRLAAFGKRHRLAESPDEADAILFVENSHYHDDPFFSRLRKHPLIRRYRERCFMYNEHDHPWCVLPGVYSSMPKRWFDRDRQRATRYIRLLNPVEASPIEEADVLFSFVGNSQIPLRREILRLKSSRAILENTRSFNAFFASGQTGNHARYAEVLKRSKFVLCPRGSGTSSIRLFETLRAGRVPIIVSDQWVAPEGPDWPSCSFRVLESGVSKIEQVVTHAEPCWPVMAANARKAWEEWFAEEVLFDRIGDYLAEIQKSGSVKESVALHIPGIAEWNWRVRRSARHFTSLLSRVSPLRKSAIVGGSSS